MKKLFITIGLLLPSVTFAATIKDFANKITTFLGKPVITLLFSSALILFVWGIAQFVGNAENSDERKKGKQHILWGIIALFGMLTFIGLTGVLTRTFFQADPVLPQFYK